MLISTELLTRYKACKSQVELFNQLWPDGIDSNVAILDAVLLALDKKLDIAWFVKNILPAAAREVYYKALAPASDVYFKAIAPDIEDYNKAVALAFLAELKKLP